MSEFKAEIRSTAKHVLKKNSPLVVTPSYFGGGHFILKKKRFPEMYQLWAGIEAKRCDHTIFSDFSKNIYLEDEVVDKLYNGMSGAISKFNPASKGEDNVFNEKASVGIKYYWFICEYLGCTLSGGKGDEPFIIRKNDMDVGFLMPTRNPVTGEVSTK